MAKILKIYYTENSILKDIDVEFNSNDYILSSVKGITEMNINFTLPNYIEFPINATYIDYQGKPTDSVVRFYLFQNPQPKKNNSENFDYSLKLSTEEGKLKKWMFKNPIDNRIKFALTARPSVMLQMVVDNCNLRDSGWSIGTCIDAIDNTITFASNKVFDALNSIADLFETEWYVIGKTIYLGKEEFNYSTPLSLSYGSGYGIKPIIDRKNQGDKGVIGRLFVQGGDKNINSSPEPDGYGSKYLLLPKGQTIWYNGISFSSTPGVGSARNYKVSADGLSVTRDFTTLLTDNEAGIDLSNIYPKRVCEVTGFNIEPNNGDRGDTRNDYYNIFDTTIPESLDYNAVQLAGQKLSVTFQTGRLAGRTFDVSQYIHASRIFKLVSINEDGQTMPNTTFYPDAGDQFIVFGCTLPNAYIRDDATKTGASWDMFREAVKVLWESEEMQVQFALPIDEIWLRNTANNIKKGDFISFIDSDFAPSGLKIRVLNLKQYLSNPYKIELTLSNIRAPKTIKGRISSLDSLGGTIDVAVKDTSSIIGRTNQDVRHVDKKVADTNTSLGETNLELNKTKLGVDFATKNIIKSFEIQIIEGFKLSDTGERIEDVNYAISNYIPVTPGSKVIVSCYLGVGTSIVGYDDESGSNGEGVIADILLVGNDTLLDNYELEIPMGNLFIRLCTDNTKKAISVSQNAIQEDIRKTNVDVTSIKNNMVSSSQVKTIVITNVLPPIEEQVEGVLYGIFV